MNLTERNIKYADLVVPFSGCPIGNPVDDCPFSKYWKTDDTSNRIILIENLTENELDNLREFHRECLMKKVKGRREKAYGNY